VPFEYYHRLNGRQKRIYRQSDEIEEVHLPGSVQLRDSVREIENGLCTEKKSRVQQASQQLARNICRQLEIVSVDVKVLARRPSDDWGELHGLYEPVESPGPAHITVWMRTAKRKQVVAFKTYLRTLLHEIGHHLDYEYFRLEESFHTEGFYKRENQLFRTVTNPGDGPLPIQYELPLTILSH